MPMTSGIAELDSVLGGGFMEGTLCAVIGPPGSGVGVFAKQFASMGNESSYYFSTMDSEEDVKGAIARFGWKTDLKLFDIGSRYYDSVLLRKLQVTKYRQEGVKVRDLIEMEHEEIRPVNFLTYLTNEIFKIRPPFRIVVDSLDFFIDNYGVEEVLNTLRTLRAFNRKNRGVLLVTMTKGIFDVRTQNSIDALVDTLIELERIRAGMIFESNLIVSKVKNFPERSRIMQYTIKENGFAVIV